MKERNCGKRPNQTELIRRAREKVFAREGGYCFWCGGVTTQLRTARDPAPDNSTLDHLYPRGDARRDLPAPLVEKSVNACRKCNNERGSKTVEQWDKILTARNKERARL